MIAPTVHGNSKLTVDQVVELRRLSSNGATVRGLASLFGISKSSAHQVASGQSYENVGIES